MAMTIGSVSVAADGTVTKTHFAEAIYDAYVSVVGALPGDEQGVPHKEALARQSNALATAILTYFQANAEVRVGVGDSGLQRSTAIGNPTNAPAAPVDFGAII